MLIAMAGLPGTGKSTLARALARRLDGAVLDKDRVRAALFPPALIEYSRPQDDLCFEVLLQAAGYLLDRHPDLPVLLDGRTFSRHVQVTRVVDAAVGMRTPFKLLLCTCAETTALARLARDRERGTHPAHNRDAALYHRIRARFEPITVPHHVVNTDQPLETCVAHALRYLTS